jgi:hypothetical protein
MNRDDLENFVKKRPFVPLRIHDSNGDTYDVPHPDGIMVSDRAVAIARGDSITFVATMHIVEIQPLPAVHA